MKDLTPAELRVAKYICENDKPCDKHKMQALNITEILKDEREHAALEALDRLAAKKETT